MAEVVEGVDLGLSGHAAFETFSVLTRLPQGLRVSPGAAARLVRVDSPAGRHLSADAAARVLERCVEWGIAGGAVYDALVAACAQEHGLPLITCDQRVRETYVAVGVEPIVVA